MRNIKTIFLLFCALSFIHPAISQSYTVSPTVPDFTDLNASCVVATYGTTADPFANIGIVNGRHTLVTQQGTDPKTGNSLQYLPANTQKVIQLGNSKTGAEAESITYHFIADADKSILLLKFAVVFEDPGHDLMSQPRFMVRIMNADGNLIESCAEYDVSARPGIEGFNDYNQAGTPIRWRNWTNVGLDMSAYAGQEVQVQIITYDCDYSGHFGYAYFTASCISSKLALEECDGNNFTAIAPEGFPSYLWHNGETTPSTHWTMGDEAINLSCEVTSATGCRFTLSGYVSDNPLPPVSATLFDTICQGDPYIKHYYNLPPQNEVGNHTYYNSFFDLNTCNGDVSTTLFLTIQQRHYPIKAEICHGTDYTENGFNFRQPSPGVYDDTLYYASTQGCDSIVSLRLFVHTSFSMPNNIIGDMSPCFGSINTYSLSGLQEGSGAFFWQFPSGFHIFSGQGSNSVLVQASDRSIPGQIVFRGINSCGEGEVTQNITPNPTYWQTLNDSACAKQEYHKNGFNIPAQDSSGYYEFLQYHKTVYGCDSNIILQLIVSPEVSIQILATDSMICTDTPIDLYALGKNSSFSTTTIPAVAIGDILCTDNTTVKPEKYNVSEKTAKGIVFWVDKSGLHGWAVNPRGSGTSQLSFGRDITVPACHNRIYEALSDTSGHLVTSMYRQAGDASQYPAAWLADFDNGWFIPAFGQLARLYAATPEINASLGLIYGEKLPNPYIYLTTTHNRNGSSTERGGINNMDSQGTILTDLDNSRRGLRTICSF